VGRQSPYTSLRLGAVFSGKLSTGKQWRAARPADNLPKDSVPTPARNEPMVFFPIIPPSQTSPDMGARVQQLEKALNLSLTLLQTLFERLETKLGPGFLGDDLRPLSTANGLGAEEEVRQFDKLLREGHLPTGVRRFKELTGATWEQANDVMARWSSYPTEQKVRWLRLALWVRALGVQAATQVTVPSRPEGK
jgi:hypothetical protein